MECHNINFWLVSGCKAKKVLFCLHKLQWHGILEFYAINIHELDYENYTVFVIGFGVPVLVEICFVTGFKC